MITDSFLSARPGCRPFRRHPAWSADLTSREALCFLEAIEPENVLDVLQAKVPVSPKPIFEFSLGLGWRLVGRGGLPDAPSGRRWGGWFPGHFAGAGLQFIEGKPQGGSDPFDCVVAATGLAGFYPRKRGLGKARAGSDFLLRPALRLPDGPDGGPQDLFACAHRPIIPGLFGHRQLIGKKLSKGGLQIVTYVV